MLRMFGLGEGEKSEIGWGQENTGEVNVDVSHPFYVLWKEYPDNIYQAGGGPYALPPNTVFFPRQCPALGDGKRR